MTQQQPAGWYPSTDRPGQQRYHDGTTWTENYAPVAQVASPQKKSGAKKVLIPLFACMGLALVLVIVGVAGSSGSDDESNATPDTEAPAGEDPETSAPEETDPPAVEQETYAVGETGTSSDLEITVNTIEDPWNSGNEFDVPPEGQRYVGVEMTIVNAGGSTTTFSTFGGVEVVDSEGRAWDVAITTSSQPAIDGDVPASATRKGWVYLSVGEDSAGLQMRVKGSFTAEGAVFALG